MRKLGDVPGAPDPLGIMGVFYHNDELLPVNTDHSLRSKYSLKSGSTIEFLSLKDALFRYSEKNHLDLPGLLKNFKQERIIDVLSSVRREQATNFVLKSYGTLCKELDSFWTETRPEIERRFDEGRLLELIERLSKEHPEILNPVQNMLSTLLKNKEGLHKYRGLYDALVKAGDEALQGMNTVTTILVKGMEIYQGELELRQNALEQEGSSRDPSMAMDMLDELSESEGEL